MSGSRYQVSSGPSYAPSAPPQGSTHHMTSSFGSQVSQRTALPPQHPTPSAPPYGSPSPVHQTVSSTPGTTQHMVPSTPGARYTVPSVPTATQHTVSSMPGTRHTVPATPYTPPSTRHVVSSNPNGFYSQPPAQPIPMHGPVYYHHPRPHTPLCCSIL